MSFLSPILKAIAWIALAVVLTFQSAWARKDWIERTLVTVDVTGLWVGGTARGGVSGAFEVRLHLQQQGQKVTGYFLALPPHPQSGLVDGPVEGTVAGDVFTFRLTNGVLEGETTTINGDEMSLTLAAAAGRMLAYLRRVDSAAPRSQ